MSAPEIEGFVFQRLLGSGGFADVYLYERQMPRSLVAVKVIRAEGLDAASQARFTREANAMARMSAHPAIVPILGAAVTSRGEPYMVMAYYPKGSLAVRARAERIPVPEVLRIGILISGAIETAHRAGILHRDIKPANILIGEFGNPGLADFGIATTTADIAADTGDELSLPWAPPEALAGSGVDASSDVYSLAATLYSLLTGRSPFEMPGERNTSAELMHRIEHMKLPPMGRGDVPATLERLLAQGMAKKQELRPSSALSFARALQDVERELRLAPTQIVIPDEVSPPPDDDGGEQADESGVGRAGAGSGVAGGDHPAASRDRTVQRPVSPWAPRGGPSSRSTDPSGAGNDVRGGVGARQGGPDTSSGTVRRPAVPEVSDGGLSETTPRQVTHRGVIIGVFVIVVLGFAIGLSLALGGSHHPGKSGTHSESTITTTIETNPNQPIPTRLTLTRAGGKVDLSWIDPHPATGDTFIVQLASSHRQDLPPVMSTTQVSSLKKLTPRDASAPHLTVTTSKDSPGVCARVRLVRASGYESGFSHWHCV